MHKSYDQVKAKSKTQWGMLGSFNNDNGVNQAYPLSNNLFGLYIEKLEQSVNKNVEAWKFVGNDSKGFSPVNVPN